jgi:hypothetical protein
MSVSLAEKKSVKRINVVYKKNFKTPEVLPVNTNNFARARRR